MYPFHTIRKIGGLVRVCGQFAIQSVTGFSLPQIYPYQNQAKRRSKLCRCQYVDFAPILANHKELSCQYEYLLLLMPLLILRLLTQFLF